MPNFVTCYTKFHFMKRLIFFFALLLSTSLMVGAQTKPEASAQAAEKALQQGNSVQSRTLYLQAYQGYASTGQYDKAIQCGTKACQLYYQANLYNEAFDLCRAMDQFISKAEEGLQKTFPVLHGQVTMERMLMYLKLKRAPSAQQQLTALQADATASGDAAMADMVLLAQAVYNYTFGMTAQGDQCMKKLTGKHSSAKEVEKLGDYYKRIISLGTAMNNSSLVAKGYEQYMSWKEEVRMLTAKDELNVLKRQYKAAQDTIVEKDDSISARQYWIVALVVIIVALAAVLLLGFMLYLRAVAKVKKVQKLLDAANESNAQKNRFIHNLSAQLTPTLDSIRQSVQAIRQKQPDSPEALQLASQSDALLQFGRDISELSTLESTLQEPYALKSMGVNTFCDEIAAQAKTLLKPGVEFFCEAPRIQIQLNKEELQKVLMHLIYNAAQYTESGHVRLEYKKRGAHINQFIVTDTGCGIPKEKQAGLFTPFSHVQDLTMGDGLGLPICALKAVKMQGTLTLDTNYRKGARFVLEIYG